MHLVTDFKALSNKMSIAITIENKYSLYQVLKFIICRTFVIRNFCFLTTYSSVYNS